MMNEFNLYILNFFIMSASAWFDARLIKKRRYFADHRPRFIIRATIVTLLVIFNPSIESIFTHFGIWFLFFDYFINIALKRPFLSLGSTAKWDKFWTGREYVLFTIRVIYLLLLVYLITN